MTHEKITHIDLFSGIGGFALATERVWGAGNVEHIFCDNEPFAQRILKKHWPESQIYGDIRTLTADAERTRLQRHQQQQALSQGKRASRPTPELSQNAILLTGGFPCQPFSQAGRRKGEADDRFLWPEMCRIIGEFQPTWVIAENVRGLLTQGGGVVFERVCTDLEALGYEVQPIIIPAVAVGAPHRRDRVWFVAYTKDFDDRGDARELSQENEQQEKERQEEWTAKFGGADSERRLTGYTQHNGFDGTENAKSGATRSNSNEEGSYKLRQPEGADSLREALANTRYGAEGLSERSSKGTRRGCSGQSSWNEPWIKVATRLCTLDDGLPNGLARPKGWRNAALKGAGNAIVPQVAEQIMRAIFTSSSLKQA